MGTTSSPGIVAYSNDLSVDVLVRAYRHGVFPWPMEGLEQIPWCCPEPRAILEFSDLHIPRSLAKSGRTRGLRFTIDQAFSDVISLCADTPRPGQPGTWILPEVTRAYTELHRAGYAHSVEAWSGDDLVGGIYGVDAGGAFSAESMFYRQPDASKLALLHLVEHLRERGQEWLDIQMMTPHLERLGARELSRDSFLKKLLQAQRRLREGTSKPF